MGCYTLDLNLDGTDFRRRVEVPDGLTYRDLGAVIMASFGIPTDVRSAFLLDEVAITDNMEGDLEVPPDLRIVPAGEKMDIHEHQVIEFTCGRNSQWRVHVIVLVSYEDDGEGFPLVLSAANGSVSRAFRDSRPFFKLIEDIRGRDGPGRDAALAEADRLRIFDFDFGGIFDGVGDVSPGSVADGAPLRDAPVRLKATLSSSFGAVELDVPAGTTFAGLSDIIGERLGCAGTGPGYFVLLDRATVVTDFPAGQDIEVLPMSTEVARTRGFDMEYCPGGADTVLLMFAGGPAPEGRRCPARVPARGRMRDHNTR